MWKSLSYHLMIKSQFCGLVNFVDKGTVILKCCNIDAIDGTEVNVKSDVDDFGMDILTHAMR